MALTDDDILKIASLLKPFERKLDQIDADMREFRNEVQTNFDSLFARDESSDQESQSVGRQLDRLESRVEKLEKAA